MSAAPRGERRPLKAVPADAEPTPQATPQEPITVLLSARYEVDAHGHYKVTYRTTDERKIRTQLVNARVQIVAAYADDVGEPYPISVTDRTDRTTSLVSHYDLRVSRPDEEPVDLPDVETDHLTKGQWADRAELSKLPVLTASGATARQDIVTAIKASSPHEIVPAYGRLGWHYRGGQWIYIHGGGAWGAGGAVPNVRVHGDGLAFFTMSPPPGDDTAGRRAFWALWRLLDMARDSIAAVEIGAAYRASMGRPKGSITYNAANRSGKSGHSAFICQCWAPGTRHDRFPFSATKVFATATYIELVHHNYGDMIVAWDDMAPVGNPAERAAYFDLFARSLFNGASKGRGRKEEGKARARMRPRAFGILTAEDIVGVESAQNRTHMLKPTREEFDAAAFTAADMDGGPEDRSALMSDFIMWWATKMPAYKYVGGRERHYMAELATATDAPARYIDSVADKAAGLSEGLAHAHARGWITQEQRDELWARVWAGLVESLGHQLDSIEGQSTPERIRDAIFDGLAGHEVHVLGMDGRTPQIDPILLGWDAQDRAQGKNLGWTDGERLYLIPAQTAAYVSAASARNGAPIEMTVKTMGSELRNAELITGSVEIRDGRTIQRSTIKKTVLGRDVPVWAMRWTPKSDQQETQEDTTQPPPPPPPADPTCTVCGQIMTSTDGQTTHPSCDPNPATGQPCERCRQRGATWCGAGHVGTERQPCACGCGTMTLVRSMCGYPRIAHGVDAPSATRATQPAETSPVNGGQVLAVGIDTDGLYLPGGEVLDVELGDIAVVLDRVVDLMPDGGSIAITAQAAVMLGYPDAPPAPKTFAEADKRKAAKKKATKPAEPRAAVDGRAGGWIPADSGIQAWTVWRQPATQRRVNVCVIEWSGGGSSHVYITPDLSAAAATERLAAWRRTTSTPYLISAGVSGCNLLASTRHHGRMPLRKWEPPTDTPIGSQLAYNFVRPVEEWTAEESAQPYVVAWDMRRAYLAAFMGATFAMDRLEHMGSVGFDPGRAGYWLIAREWRPYPKLPDLRSGGTVSPSEPVWVDTAMVEEMIKRGMPEEMIIDAWLSPRETGHSARIGRRPFAETIRDALKECEDANLRAALKACYRETYGNIHRDTGVVYRPDWADTIRGFSRSAVTRNVIDIGKTTGRWPVEIDVDCAYYPAASETDNPGFGDADVAGKFHIHKALTTAEYLGKGE